MKETKKILIVSGSKKPLQKNSGGAIEELVTKLYEQNRSDDRYNLYLLSEHVGTDCPEENRFYYLPENKIFSGFIQKTRKFFSNKPQYTSIKQSLLKKMEEICSNVTFDEVILLNYGAYAPYIRRFFHGKLSLYLHNDYLNIHTDGAQEILKNIDRVLAVSFFLCEEMNKIDGAEGLPKQVVENGINIHQFHPVNHEQKIDIRKKWQIPIEKEVVLFCGRVDKSKGIYELIQVIKRKKVDNVLLVIAGTGNVRNKLRVSIASHHKNILNLGQIAQDEIETVFQASDICVVPSYVKESFCLVNIEAQACGIPVITTNSGALRDYFTGPKELLITDLNELAQNIQNSLFFYLENKKQIQTINYRNHAIQYSHIQMYEQFSKAILTNDLKEEN